VSVSCALALDPENQELRDRLEQIPFKELLSSVSYI